jgi:NAD(P)-dependent dehydrogenase (short-subunit alcohol dehydrogenase family)
MRLQDRIAMVVGAGQSPGETMGNGRATAIVFAREGAKVVAVDRDLASAQETVAMIEEAGGTAMAVAADVTDEAAVKAAVDACLAEHGRIDILHNNVGISIAGGDAEITEITVEAFDHCVAVNLRGMVLACKHALPSMREQGSGVILNISSLAAWSAYPLVAYKTTKAAVVALTDQLAILNARYGIRANVILPGLMDTPMAKWAPAGTLPTRRCSWPRTKPASSPVRLCRWMAARRSVWAARQGHEPYSYSVRER